MRETFVKQLCKGGCALALLVAWALPAAAQARGNIRSTSRITIKPERLGDFQAAAKEYATIVKKAGWDKSFTVWRSQTGPSEFLLSRYFEKWADIGPESGMAQDPKLKEVSADLMRLGVRIAQCEDKTERLIAEVLPELSLPRAAEPPVMIRVLRSQVKPDRVDEYLTLIQNEVLPAAKKSGATTFSVARVRYGAPSTEFISVLGLQGWGDMDGGGPIVKAMGGENAYRAFLRKITPLLVESQYDVYRFQPDLSYRPPR